MGEPFVDVKLALNCLAARVVVAVDFGVHQLDHVVDVLLTPMIAATNVAIAGIMPEIAVNVVGSSVVVVGKLSKMLEKCCSIILPAVSSQNIFFFFLMKKSYLIYRVL